MKTPILIVSIILLITLPAYAGTNFKTISSSTVFVQLDKVEEQRREAKKLTEGALSPEELRLIEEQAQDVIEKSKRGSSAVHPTIHKLEELQQAVYEHRAFRPEILLFLSIHKKDGVLNDWEVFRLGQLAQWEHYKEALEFMSETIEKYGASVQCHSEVIN